MARNDSVDGTDSSDNGSPDLDKLQTDFGFRGPVALRMLAEEAATTAKLPLTTYLRNVLAKELGYAIQTTAQTTRGMTDEEKAAKLEAQKAAAKEQRKLVKALLDESRPKKEEATPATA